MSAQLFGPRCLCIDCSPAAPGPTYSEQFRHECEVRYVADLPGTAARVEYLRMVVDKRGYPAGKRLRDDAVAELKRRREATAVAAGVEQ